jgi:hypothetical protein
MQEPRCCETCIHHKDNYCDQFDTVIPSDFYSLPDACDSYEHELIPFAEPEE